ncbi:MAG: zeta toxin family protein [Methanomassiliicoccaceae archaeon]|nr:zeta toxin family protein [Methanomassiliicoccaceae archaeon]
MSDRRLLVVAGPNGSGKSSIVTSSGIAKDYGDNIINPDNYAKFVYDIEDYTERYLFAMKQCDNLRNDLLELGVPFGFETVASTQGKIDFIKKAAAKGYKIQVVFVSLESPELCYQRVKKRVERGGHDVERSKVFSRYGKAMNYLKEYIRIADAASVFDNSGDEPILVFSKNNEKMQIIKEPSEIPWVERYIHRHFKDAERVLKIDRKQ